MKWKEFTSREPGYSTLSGIERRRLRQAFDADKPNGVEDIMLKLRVVREQAAAEQAAAEQAERERILALTPPTEEGGDPPLP